MTINVAHRADRGKVGAEAALKNKAFAMLLQGLTPDTHMVAAPANNMRVYTRVQWCRVGTENREADEALDEGGGTLKNELPVPKENRDLTANSSTRMCLIAFSNSTLVPGTTLPWSGGSSPAPSISRGENMLVET